MVSGLKFMHWLGFQRKTNERRGRGGGVERRRWQQENFLILKNIKPTLDLFLNGFCIETRKDLDFFKFIALSL
jgi:hypothetical protein